MRLILQSILPLPADGGGLWLPEAASTVAEQTDATFWLVMWISVVFFIIIVVGMVWFMIAYRRRPGVEAIVTVTHHYALELTWSVVPTLLIVVIFAYGMFGFLNLRQAPDDADQVNVIAKKWGWTFSYPTGINSNELHAVLNNNTSLVMESDDVIHSLFIADFRIKQDIVPGRFTHIWFNATIPGKYWVQCTEYCGRGHSDMKAPVVIHQTQAEFDCWLQEEYKKILSMPPIELGKKLYEEKGCAQCHLLTDQRKVGPGFAQTYNQMHEFIDGPPQKGDDAYIRESILNPSKKIRAGFAGGNMPSYAGQLLPQELRGLEAFIKSQNPELKKQVEQEYAKPPGEKDAEPEEVLPNDPCVEAAKIEAKRAAQEPAAAL